MTLCFHFKEQKSAVSCKCIAKQEPPPSKALSVMSWKPQDDKAHTGSSEENDCRQSIWKVIAPIQVMVAWTRVVRVEMMKNGENQREFEDYNQQNMLMDYIWEVRERKISRITFGYLTCTTECLVEPFFFFKSKNHRN